MTFEDTVNDSEIVKETPLGQGKTGAILVEYANGVRGVRKPASLHKRPFRGIPRNQLWINEVAAYRLDQACFKYEIVPSTCFTHDKHGIPCSIQKYTKGFTAPDIVPNLFNPSVPGWKERMARFFAMVDRKGIMKVILFDLVTNNVDRHAKNLIFPSISGVAPGSSHPVAIDNSSIGGAYLQFYRNVFHKYMFLTSFECPDELLEPLRRQTADDYYNALTGLYTPKRRHELARDIAARAKWVVQRRHDLPFYTLSKENLNNDHFPAYASELNAIKEGENLRSKRLVVRIPLKGSLERGLRNAR